MQIENINLEMTDACNLRCVMCDIWKEKNSSYFTAEMIDKVFSSNVLSEKVDITLTGGEAFLHPEFFSLVARICHFRPSGIQTLSTNGVLSEAIASFMSRFYASLPESFSVHISLDGIHAHDTQRGTKSKLQIFNTIRFLKQNYPAVPIKIKYTITPLNYADILETYFFCKKNGLVFKPKIVEYASNYTNRLVKRMFTFTSEQKARIREDLLCINKEMNSLFVLDSIKFLYDENEAHYCLTPFNRAFIMSTGDVFSCIHFPKIGNIKEDSLESIWNSSTAISHRVQVDTEMCRKCVSYHGAKTVRRKN